MEVQDIDDVPVSALIHKKLEKAQEKENGAANKSDGAGHASDSEDDIPIMELIKRRLAKKERENREREKEREREKRRREEEDDRKSKKEKRKSSADDEGPAEKRAVSGSNVKANGFYQTDKGRIAQSLLVRWWYAYDWPLAEDIGVPPAGYESLDGFPGVFVSTRVSTCAKLLSATADNEYLCTDRFFGNNIRPAKQEQVSMLI
jgi:hypothetical protein